MASVEFRDERTALRVRLSDPLYADVLEWLIEEAELLDGNRLLEWLDRLAPDLTYTMPIRTTTYRADGDGVNRGYAHFEESYASLEVRVRRILRSTGWAEDPPSRTRRFVTNVRVRETGPHEYEVKSNLLVMRSRGDQPNYEMISCERRDLLRRVEEGLELADREIIVDQSSLSTVNLALFL